MNIAEHIAKLDQESGIQDAIDDEVDKIISSEPIEFLDFYTSAEEWDLIVDIIERVSRLRINAEIEQDKIEREGRRYE